MRDLCDRNCEYCKEDKCIYMDESNKSSKIESNIGFKITVECSKCKSTDVDAEIVNYNYPDIDEEMIKFTCKKCGNILEKYIRG